MRRLGLAGEPLQRGTCTRHGPHVRHALQHVTQRRMEIGYEFEGANRLRLPLNRCSRRPHTPTTRAPGAHVPRDTPAPPLRSFVKIRLITLATILMVASGCDKAKEFVRAGRAAG